MNQKSQEQIAAEKLSRALLERMGDFAPGQVAAIAHVQSTMTNAAVQAVIELMVHKGVISQGDFAAALQFHYNKKHDELVHRDNQIITPTDAPIARPS